MRPDLAAFRELDTVVRNLGEQLAGYRRRALAAEARIRDLEHLVSTLTADTEHARRDAVSARAQAQTLARQSAEFGVEGMGAHSEVAIENGRLRARLVEARERTAVVIDRVRFLRQQLSTSVER